MLGRVKASDNKRIRCPKCLQKYRPHDETACHRCGTSQCPMCYDKFHRPHFLEKEEAPAPDSAGWRE